MRPRKVIITMEVETDEELVELMRHANWDYWRNKVRGHFDILKIHAKVKPGKSTKLGDIMKRVPIVKDKKFVDYLKTLGTENVKPERGKK